RGHRQVRDVLLVDGQWRFLGASRLPVRDRRRCTNLAGPDHQNTNPELTQSFSESEVEAVEAGFGRSVHEVGAPYPLTGRRAHRYDLPEALSAHLLSEQHPHRNRCGVVDFGDLNGLALVLPQLLGIAK